MTWSPRRWWGASGGYSLLLLALGSIPGAVLAHAPQVWDKAAHAVVYGVLGGLAFWAARVAGLSPGRAIAVAVLWAAALGLVDEWHQQWVPHRTSSGADLAADVIGAASVACAAAGLSRTFRHVRGEAGRRGEHRQPSLPKRRSSAGARERGVAALEPELRTSGEDLGPSRRPEPPERAREETTT